MFKLALILSVSVAGKLTSNKRISIRLYIGYREVIDYFNWDDYSNLWKNNERWSKNNSIQRTIKKALLPYKYTVILLTFILFILVYIQLAKFGQQYAHQKTFAWHESKKFLSIPFILIAECESKCDLINSHGSIYISNGSWHYLKNIKSPHLIRPNNY